MYISNIKTLVPSEQSISEAISGTNHFVSQEPGSFNDGGDCLAEIQAGLREQQALSGLRLKKGEKIVDKRQLELQQ